MTFETGAPPPPPPLPDVDHSIVVLQPDVLLPPVLQAPPARPARGYDATNVVYPGLVPPGVTTYRLKGIETTEVE
jgi:hypothetical protein